MVNIIKEELTIEESLRRKLELICEFAKTTLTIINGNIRKIDKTNWLDGKTIYYENVIGPIVLKELWDNCHHKIGNNLKLSKKIYQI